MNRLFWITVLSLLCLGVSAADQHAVAAYDQVVAQQSTTLALTTLPATATTASPVTFAAHVAGSQQNTAAPSGTVTFQIADAAQNTQVLVGQLTNGDTSVTATLPAARYTVTATYNGSSNFSASSSSETVNVAQAVSQAPPAQDFAFSLSNATATVAQGSSVSNMVTVTGVNGFAGQVTLACANLPDQMACAFDPATITANSNGVQSALTVSTAGSTVTVASTGLLVFGFFAVPFPCGRKGWRQHKLRLVALLALMALIGGLAACGGKPRYMQTDGTATGAYRLLVTATSGNISHSNTLTITVR